MRIGNKEFDVNNHTYVMGILNVTPDSFSDGGNYDACQAAMIRVQEMIEQGADIIDVGGESTRPGYEKISEECEIQRILPVIKEIKTHFSMPVSVDTYKAQVAQAAIDAGADLINDIWGLKYQPEMAKVIAKGGVACCLMHNRENSEYQDFMKELKEDLTESLGLAEAAGIAKQQIILDPGVGFGKSYQQNLQVIASLEQLHELGCPLLLGTSRKSVIGQTLDLPVEERLEGTLVTTVYGVLKGCGFVRVHDIKENVRVIKMTEALVNKERK